MESHEHSCIVWPLLPIPRSCQWICDNNYFKCDSLSTDPVFSVTLSVSNLSKSIGMRLLVILVYVVIVTCTYTIHTQSTGTSCWVWHCTPSPTQVLYWAMETVRSASRVAVYQQHKVCVLLQARLELVQMTEPINRAEAFGRIAFSCPKAEVLCSHGHSIIIVWAIIIMIASLIPFRTLYAVACYRADCGSCWTHCTHSTGQSGHTWQSHCTSCHPSWPCKSCACC